MPIHYVVGDLFANTYRAQAFAHGVNCKGVMGKGIALEFRLRYPEMYAEYRRRCLSGQLHTGEVFYWVGLNPQQPTVFNLATQDDYRGPVRATLPAIRSSLFVMLEMADFHNIMSIAMPRIGSGLGGLPWADVKEAIEHVCDTWSGDLYIYDLYRADPTERG